MAKFSFCKDRSGYKGGTDCAVGGGGRGAVWMQGAGWQIAGDIRMMVAGPERFRFLWDRVERRG